MDRHTQLASYLKAKPLSVGKVVDFDKHTDILYHFDFTANNRELSAETIADTASFCNWIDAKLQTTGCRYGIGGYMEHRTLYARSPLFNTVDQPRRLHLGIDIWGKAGTPVYAPLAGNVHSFKDNNHFGDYGPTIILEHNLDGLTLYTLYGHLNRQSLDGLYTGMPFSMNQQLALFGNTDQNGHWPPHLHFQLMFDMEGLIGDYPGVCRLSEMEKYAANIPNPSLILQF